MPDSHPNPIENAEYERDKARETIAPITIESTPAQIFDGEKIGTGQHAVCDDCGRSIGELSRVLIHATRHSDESQWVTSMVYCAGCQSRHADIEQATRGMAEIIVSGTLALRSDPAEQHHVLVFNPDAGNDCVIEYVPADE